jgi:hypothetical protein
MLILMHQMADEQVYIKLLQQMLSSKHFYYSHTLDLTKSLQQQLPIHNLNNKNIGVNWHNADQYFLANRVPLASIKVLDPSFPQTPELSPFDLVVHQSSYTCYRLVHLF